MPLTDRQKWWFQRFPDLKQGDIVRFGWFELTVFSVISFGGAVFQAGEIIPALSQLWEQAEVIGKQAPGYFEAPDEEEEVDPSLWWKR